MEARLAEHPANPDLPVPHFDEEATVLSARPVVPLREVEASNSSRNNLILGLMLTLAVIAGALGAALVYQQRSKDRVAAGQTDAATLSATGVQLTAGIDGEVVSTPAASVVPAPVKPDDTSTRPARNTEPPVRAVAGSQRASQRVPASRYDSRQTEDIDRRALWEERRAERWRRVRDEDRESGRDARRGRPSKRDLMRIREIFEGSPRPE
jgi:hypothetical protein